MALALNTDVLLLVLEHLDLPDLLRLAETSRLLHLLVHRFAWSIFLRNNRRYSLTLHSSRSRWSPLAQVRYNVLADRAWSRVDFIARPLSRPWRGNLQPAVALSVSTLLVAAGHTLYSYAVQDTSGASPSRIVFERPYTLTLGRGAVQPDITSIASLPGQDRTAFLGFEDGSVEQICLPSHQGRYDSHCVDITRTPQNAVQHHHNVVKSISYSMHTLLSLSQSGSVFLTSLVSDGLLSTSINLAARGWASHLCMSTSSPYAVFGTTSATPLSIYYITPDGFPSTPSIALQPSKDGPSAVYGIACAPPSSPLGPSEQIIVSGWYDGSVCVYDLRTPYHSQSLAGPGSVSTSTSTSSPPVLPPVFSMGDRWLPEPIYSVSCGGGNASFVAAGMARHSVVAFWDVRQPSRGWSVYTPGNDPSPVYSMALESSRLFGATQSRPFVYDFGPGVTRDTYPIGPTSLHSDAGRRGTTRDELRLERNGIGYQFSMYFHRRTAVF